MEIVQFKEGEVIARQNDTVKQWYIVQQGIVIQKNHFVETELSINSIIGILEQDFFICDYIAKTDCTMIQFTCQGVADLKHFLEKQGKMRVLFLRNSVNQRYQQFRVYDKLYRNANKFATFVEKSFQLYQTESAKYRLVNPNGPDISTFTPLNITHALQQWELESCASLMKNGVDDYMNLYTKDYSLCVGAIMEASAQMHRVAQGISEMISFFTLNRDLLISDNNRDIFHGYMALFAHLKKNKLEYAPTQQDIGDILTFASSLAVYSDDLIDLCSNEFEELKALDPDAAKILGDDEDAGSDIEFIIDYAGIQGDDRELYLERFEQYSRCYGSASSRDSKAYKLRKQCTNDYYEIYKGCFFRAIRDNNVPTTIEMFMNFGFVDSAFLDEEKMNGLYSVATRMDMCRSEHVFTMFDWLKAVYSGEKAPSKNEFDMDFGQYLLEEYKQGNIKKSDIEAIKADPVARTTFEIDNMFKSVNRITYGSISNFTAILNGNDLFNSPDKLLATRDKIYNALNQIRVVDFSAFYRPLFSHDFGGDMSHESIQKEILPDVILMPNAGSKGMMWQETASIKNDTPARFMIPIFTGSDINDMMLELTGRYRWEICRKIQGVRWNDIREHCLTSDYYDYLQFYKKNHDLSQEAKDQIKGNLARSKNNFREVFVRDYANWIQYEAKGGFRLNKYVRNIMFAYCPFAKEIRTKLEDSPMFSDAIHKYNVNNAKVVKRLNTIYDRYSSEFGSIPQEMKENLDYYEM